MTRAYVPLLLTLASIWGASYLFIKVGVRDLAPAVLMDARMLLAAALLFAFLAARTTPRRAAAQLRDAWRPGLVLGILNAAVPFTLIAWGEERVDSGVAAVANATVPLFVALLAVRVNPSERPTGIRLAGVVVGLAGVVLLAGGQPGSDAGTVAGTLAVVAASLCYAASGLYAQLRVGEAGGPVLATASMVWGALVLLPLALVTLPQAVPGWKPLASLLALAVLGTAFAQLVLFRMLRLHGASRTTLVTYLMPALAIVYGAVLLDEPVTAAVLGGLVLILAGVVLGSGAVGAWRRPAGAGAPP